MIEIKNLSKEFHSEIGTKNLVLKQASFDIKDGKITSLIAESGSGKSVLLKIIAGIEKSTSGEVLNPSGKKIILIPSAPSSFPWLNVYENVRFGLEEFNEAEIKKLIAFVGLEGYETFYPDNKSTGFRFRIALARSLAHNPSAILLDEPFNQMESLVKNEIYSLLRKINKIKNTSFLLATSNLEEALFLSDKILLLKKHPAEVFAEFNVDLPAERGKSIYSNAKFLSLQREIEDTFNRVKSQSLFNFSI